MKTALAVLLISLVSISFSPRDQEGDTGQGQDSVQTVQQEIPEFPSQDTPSPYQDEDDMLLYDQEIFSRKLFQKTLPQLSKKETIIWSFRLADPDPYL
jgi:hypothetical protein